MSGFNILEFDSSRLNSPAAVATAVQDIYCELRRGCRVVVRVRGRPWSAQAAGWLGFALEQAGVPCTIDRPSGPEGTLTTEHALDEIPLRVIVCPDDAPGIAQPRSLRSSKPLKIVLLGLGTVGLGVYRHLSARPDLFDVRRVAVRDPAKHQHDGVPSERLSTNLWHAINEPADLVIELAGGVDPVGNVVHAALLRGRPVISANKALIAARWDSLERYVRTPYPRLRFSAAVGGSLPVLESVARLAADGTIAGVRAVINGTCNFVLDELARGVSFADAVALAQRSGFAEADPRTDLSGTDAAQKLSLIARAAFAGATVAVRVECRGIESLTSAAIVAAETRGCRIRLVASCSNQQGTIRACVRPEELAADDYLAGCRREENRVEITTTTGATLRLAGKGAGRWPTALSVMGDVSDLLESRASNAATAPLRSARR